MSEAIDRSDDKERFLHHLGHSLRHLYDPLELRSSPLLALLGADRRRDPVFALREMLLSAIEALVPQGGVPPTTRSWRTFQILHRRYGQQRTQKEVSADLGLGIRQLQREERLAREVLADYLVAKYDLGGRLGALPTFTDRPSDEIEEAGIATSSRKDELQQLDRAVPIRLTDVSETIREVLEISQPLLEAYRVRIRLSVCENLLLPLKTLLLRQALFSAVGAIARMSSDGEIEIRVDLQGSLVTIRILSDQPRDLLVAESGSDLDMADQLLRLCGGKFTAIAPQENSTLSRAERRSTWGFLITLPVNKPVQVLVIDDNNDVRMMFERYLSATNLHFIGASSAVEGLLLAEKFVPDIIVLDVMMPGQDGWATLGQLRVHPVTADIPVIICTILAQEDLALALGAADFLRKPVTQLELIQALERQLPLEPQGSD